MSTPRTLVVSVAVVLTAAAALTGCAGMQGMSPTLAGVETRIAGIDFDGVDLAFDLDVDNPLPVTIPAPLVSYDFAVEGSRMATANSAKFSAIDASKRSRHTVPMRIGFKDLANVVMGFEGKSEAAYRFAGSFALPAAGQTFTVPFDKEGTFPVVRPPSVSVRSVDTSGVSYTGGKLAVDADFVNPNAFGIGIDDLGWALDFAGARIGGLRATTGGEVGPKQTKSLRLEASLSAAQALKGLLSGGGKGGIGKLTPTGSVKTPWGAIPLK